MKNAKYGLAIGFLMAATAFSPATTLGLYDPFGRSGNPGVESALWDSFSENYSSGSGAGTLYTYTGIPGTSTLANLSLVQSSAHISSTTETNPSIHQGAGLLLGGDAYYSSTKAQTWTLQATTSIDVTTMSFQIKTANVNPSLLATANYFVPTLNGVGLGTYIRSQATGETISGFQAYVIEYQWVGLDFDAGTEFEITFAMAGGNSGLYTRKPVDAVAVDVAAVPEPSTYGLLALGAGVLCWVVRRRSCRI